MKQYKRIIITGGHVTPALAVIEKIRKTHPDWQISVIGRKYTMEGKSIVSEEERLFTKQNVSFYPLTTGRFQRFFSFVGIISFLKIPIGFFQALYYLLKIRPTVILTFGGYIGFPVGIIGKILGIPIIIHEQTSVMGLSNSLVSRCATKILLPNDSLIKKFPKEKTEIVGVPIRSYFYKIPAKTTIHFDNSRKILYITGGATGALSINDVLFPMISKLVETYTIIHQTGTVSYEKAEHIRNALPVQVKDRYVIRPYFDGYDVAYFMHHAYIVICRSGSNTLQELIATGAVSILIPLPWSGGHEQELGATTHSLLGTSVVIDQKNLTQKAIFQTLRHIDETYQTMKLRATKLKQTFFASASDQIVLILERFIDRG